jgi:hypothetical protein
MMGSQYRHRRTSDPTVAFPGLEPGEISVNTANRQLAVGDANSGTVGAPVVLLGIRLYDVRAKYLTGDLMVRSGIIYRALVDVVPSAFTPAQWEPISGTVNPNYVQKIGDTMTGPLVLAADPAAPLEATTKQYSDTKLPKAGGTMTGAIVLPGNPTAPLQASTKQYVDAQVAAKAAVFTSDTPPAGVPDNSLWWESDTGLLFVRYNDGDSTQWVLAMPMPDVSQFVQKVGDTMAGPLTLPGDPTAVLHAAPKQYVDASAAATLASVNARAVRYDAAQALTTAQQLQARQNIYAAPFDAMAYNGLQINGAMEINQQANSGAWIAVSNYVIDMFKVAFSRAGSTFLQQHFASGGPPGLPFAIGAQVSAGAFTTLAAGDICIFLQYIEGYRCLRLGWGTANAQPITVGFWIYATAATGIGTLSVRNTASNRSYVQNFNVNAAATWQYVSLTVPGDTTGTWLTDNNFGLAVGVCVGSGATYHGVNGQWQAGNMMGTPQTSSNFFPTNTAAVYLAGLTVHPGSEGPSAARSPLIMRPYDQELQMCKRQFWRTYGVVGGYPYLYGNAHAVNQPISATIPFPVSMRALPTLSRFGLWTAQNCPQPSINNASTEGALFYTSSNATGTVSAYPADATCYLSADARY